MVKRCSWGLCKSDTRYPDRLEGGVKFFRFPRWIKTKPNNREKCLLWIKACNRPHEQLNIEKVEKGYNFYICGKHFVDGAPSDRYPDPIPAQSSENTSAKPKLSRPHPWDRSSIEPPGKRHRQQDGVDHCETLVASDTVPDVTSTTDTVPDDTSTSDTVPDVTSTSDTISHDTAAGDSHTDVTNNVSEDRQKAADTHTSLDVLALAAESCRLEKDLKILEKACATIF